jgi:hypothetical protein
MQWLEVIAMSESGSIATVSRCPRYVRFSSDSDQIADAPTRRIKCAPAARETAGEPQVHPCAEQRSRTQANLGGPSRFTHSNFKVFRGHTIIDRGHANASFTLSIAGCLRFLTLIRSGHRPAR